jgi:hypothetical protein
MNGRYTKEASILRSTRCEHPKSLLQFSRSLARTTLPSAVTTSIERTVSLVHRRAAATRLAAGT